MIGRMISLVFVIGSTAVLLEEGPPRRVIPTSPATKKYLSGPPEVSLDSKGESEPGQKDVLALFIFGEPSCKEARQSQEDMAGLLRWEAFRHNLPQQWVLSSQYGTLPANYQREWIPQGIEDDLAQGKILVQFVRRHSYRQRISQNSEDESDFKVVTSFSPPFNELLTSQSDASKCFIRNEPRFPAIPSHEEDSLRQLWAAPLALALSSLVGFWLIPMLGRNILKCLARFVPRTELVG